MDEFARIIVGYHGCRRDFAESLLLGKTPVADWEKSVNRYDWLGEGIYFWEHSPGRSLRWAEEKHERDAAVIGAVIQLKNCFDLLDERATNVLADSYGNFRESFAAAGRPMPENRGKDKKQRDLDCAVINDCIDRLRESGIIYDTVRGAFLEGDPIFEGTTISAQTHIQIAVRNADCILGVFRPNL